MSNFIRLFESADFTPAREVRERNAEPAPDRQKGVGDAPRKIPRAELESLAQTPLEDIRKYRDTVARCAAVFGPGTPQTLRAVSLLVIPFFSGSKVRELDDRLGLDGRLRTRFDQIDTRVREWKEKALDAVNGGDPEGFRLVDQAVDRAAELLQTIRESRAE